MTMWQVGDKAIAKESVAPYACTSGLTKGAIYTIYGIEKHEYPSFGGFVIIVLGMSQEGLYFDIGQKCKHGNPDLWHESLFEKFVEFKAMDKLRAGLKIDKPVDAPAPETPKTPEKVTEPV